VNTKNLFRKKTIAHILSDAGNAEGQTGGMKKMLSVYDLTALGVAAIVGAGIFSTVGNAAASGGPAVSVLFIFTAVACGLSAMCYAEFASAVPISGSAYTYAYLSFGELIAWIIGWDLIMEYAIGNIAVAISWSGYFTGLTDGLGFHIPDYLATDFLSASRGYHTVLKAIEAGTPLTSLSSDLQESYRAWTTAPQIGNIHLVANLPALFIVVVITWICYIGIRESRMTNDFFVLLKVILLLLVIGIGAFYVNPSNWSPFAPNGISGVMKGVSGVFFAYIGFDAISTTAEECRNPRRDLPLSMFYALLITTILYVLVSLVLTGMVPYTELGVSDPMAYVFSKLHLVGLSGVIAAGAVIAMASVLLVFQLGQPRIWMSMSRDGLLPPVFARLHPKYRTPGFSTILTGFVVAIPSLFLNLTEVTDLTSIGTLFAFILVSGGIIILNPKGEKKNDAKGFHVPYANSRKYLLPLWAVVLLLIGNSGVDLSGWNLNEGGIGVMIQHHFPFLIFCLVSVFITFKAIQKQWSIIPVLGLLTNLYLMSELGETNWFRFGIWLVIGLLIYFFYGIRNSKLISTTSRR
jgi:basic amino acid/polyamine antiporter, APA family